MPSDPSIYGLIQQQPGPLDQYGKVLNLKALMGQNQLQGLQTEKLTGDMAEETAAKNYLKGLAPGVDPTSDESISGLQRVAPNRAMQFRKDALATRETQGKIAHTAAQTGEITAGHIAGAWGALAQGGGSDESVKNAESMMAPLLGPEKAAAVTQKLLSMPPETRLAYAVAQAGAHKTGQEALKLFFPQAHMQDTGGTVTPISTSTLPGGAPAGTPLQGATPLVKTQTPDSAAAQATARRGQDMTDARAREMNGILEGQGDQYEAARKVTAKAIADGEMPFPVVSTRSNPMAMSRASQLIADAKAINPNITADTYNTTKATQVAFAKGKQGDNVRAINNTIEHVQTIRELAAALQNGDTQLFNKLSNKLAEATGSAAPTNLESAARIVGGEVVKGIAGAGGGVEERGEAAKVFSNIKSPAQIEGAVNTVVKLLGGQLHGLEQQYTAGTNGRKDFHEKYLTPAAKAAFEKAKPTDKGGPAASNIRSQADAILASKSVPQ